MGFLVAALVLVGALVVVDLVLTLGVVRRLREHSALISQALESGDRVADFMLPTGTRLPELRATTVDGAPVPEQGPLLVGFFSPTCRACVERLPGFVDYARAFDGRVLGVAVGAHEDVEDIVARLRPVAEVAVEPAEGPLATALRVRGMPAMAVVDADGVIVGSGYELVALPKLSTV
ncbi:TlpA family protein disulfide reductase [Actinophytocola xanthii]|uniref:Thioredoxin domain-containing protein n=1 Tax=Actinophytocola xanthii TaxID=1912961 RepID=A0A1Q8CY02_9PSEU|nr:TlpA disulfide reductase family protein [Actinophytocola xanthii]OLF19241.1 hypothetical protein BU204_02505 [Actinophytocola xanthii]